MKKIFVNKGFILLALLAFFVNHGYGQNRKLIRVLIVDGFSNHHWKQTTKLTKWMLEESGRFAVDVSTIPVDSLLQLNYDGKTITLYVNGELEAISLWVSMGGKEDIAHNNCKTMLGKFDELGIKYTYSEYPGGHAWPVWRNNLYTSLEYYSGKY